MSGAPHCHHVSKPHQCPSTSSAAPDSRVLSLHGDSVKLYDCNTSNASKVKRRKTKKELNHAKFKSHIETFKKKPLPRGALQKNSALGKMVTHSGTRDACNSWQVFITENRLTHHQGIFNREIKSIDIGRLVNQEAEPSKTGAARCPVKTPQSQGNLSLGLIPTPGSKNQDVPSPQKEPSPGILVRVSEPASCNQEDKAMEESCPPSDNHANPGGDITASLRRNQPAPVLETAESIAHMLNTHSLFPGRSLMKETRRAITEKVRHLRDTKPTPSAEPVQGQPEHSHTDLEGWESGGSSISKTDSRTQRERRPIQAPPIRFLPFPGVSPAHTLIKMTSPEEHLKLKDTGHQPIRYGSDCNPSLPYQEISSQIPHNMLNITSPSPDPKKSRRDRKASSFCRVKMAGKMTSSPANDNSPQVRWRLSRDLPTDPSYTSDVPSYHSRPMLNPRVECRTALEDIPLERLHPSQGRPKQRFPNDNRTSDWKSPATKILNISPAAIRLCYKDQSPPRRYSASHFGCHHGFFSQVPHTGTSRQGVLPMDSFGKLGRETKRYALSWQETGIGGLATSTVPKPRHLQESRSHNWWHPPSLVREEPKQTENDRGVEWTHSKQWPYVQHYSHQRNTSAALSPPSIQRKTSSLPNEKSLRKVSISRLSPDTWVYPRMKLY